MKINRLTIKKINNILVNFKEIKIAYLFGSAIKYDNFHDIDIGLVIANNSNTPYENFEFACEVAGKLEKEFNYKYEFDVKILDETPIYFQYEVVRKGKRIYTVDEAYRVEYEAHLASQYLDYKPILDWFNKKILERI